METRLQVHTKQRLVALAALLHSRAPSSRSGDGGGKVVVFLSTCAGVEFHHALLASAAMRQLGVHLPGKLFKLHGNLSQVCTPPVRACFIRSRPQWRSVKRVVPQACNASC